MGKCADGTYKAGEREFQLLLAAGLIRRFETTSGEDIYDKALKCFEGLVDIQDSKDTAAKISVMIDRHVAFVQNSAASIIDHLLFNKRNDPYLSLGLPKYAGKAEVTRRWKRLIVLYHPDRYPGRQEYEEKAKKINKAYEEIRRRKDGAVRHEPLTNIYSDGLRQAETVYYSKYLRRLPLFILALAIFMALISILFFLQTLKDDAQLYNQENLSGYAFSDELGSAINTSCRPSPTIRADGHILWVTNS